MARRHDEEKRTEKVSEERPNLRIEQFEQSVSDEVQQAILVHQVLEALAHFQNKQEEPVSILVPTGTADRLKSLDIAEVASGQQLPILQGLSIQEVTRIAETWRMLVENVPIIESEEVRQPIIVTVTMDTISRLHEHYVRMGLPEALSRRGIPFEQLAASAIYPQLLTQMLALELFTELITRTPKLVIPTPNINIPAGNA